MAGSTDPVVVAASSRDYYSSIYVDSAADSNASDEFSDLFTKLTNSINNDAMPHVKFIATYVKRLKSGKSCRIV